MTKIFKKISPILSSKIAIAVIFTLLGISLAALAQNLKKPHDEFDDFSKIIEDHNKRVLSQFNSDSIFDEMEEMQDRMDQMIKSHHKHMNDLFKKTNKDFGNSNHSSIKSREDENTYYYELNFWGTKKENVSVEIKNGNLTFRAAEEKNDETNKSRLSNNFYYSFSLPKNIVGEPEISREDNKITVKLTKNTKKT